jgi:hypothetical protein
MGASVSLRSSRVVPEEISEWKPEIAPHAIVMKQNGNTCLRSRPGPVGEARERREMISGAGDDTTASAPIVPSLTKVEGSHAARAAARPAPSKRRTHR